MQLFLHRVRVDDARRDRVRVCALWQGVCVRACALPRLLRVNARDAGRRANVRACASPLRVYVRVYVRVRVHVRVPLSLLLFTQDC